MGISTVPAKANAYSADVATGGSGTSVVGQPCTVWEITVVSDAAGDANVSIANGLTYTNANRVAKAKTTDENQTVQLVYPKGKKFSTGVAVKANKSSVDVSVTYD
jgi:hypothetical protein